MGSPEQTRRKVLIVDDDAGIVTTLRTILELNHFVVTTATSVPLALQLISQESFDVLVSDLNIGQPGDGFTVVSALRRTHPNAAALILTGFPALDAALQAIRGQVDEFLVKPVPPLELLNAIDRVWSGRTAHPVFKPRPLFEIIRESREAIIGGWTERMITYTSQVGRGDIQGEKLVDHLPDIVEELCRGVERRNPNISPEGQERARFHGELRRSQNVGPLFLLAESTAIRQEVLSAVHRRLLSVNVSSLFLDLSIVSDSLDGQLKTAMKALLEPRR